MNRKQIQSTIRKLRISSNCVVLIRGDAEHPEVSTSLADRFVEGMDAVGAKDSFVIVVDDLDNIRMLNKAEMNRAGWFRREQLAELFVKMAREAGKEEVKDA